MFGIQKSLLVLEPSRKHLNQKMDKFLFLPFLLAFAHGQFYQPGYHGDFYPYPYQPFPQPYESFPNHYYPNPFYLDQNNRFTEASKPQMQGK